MDPISDMLIRIKNAQASGHPSVEIPFSKLKFALAKILEREKFINSVEEKGSKPTRRIQIVLKYNQGNPAIENLIRKSKPSQRLYLKKEDIRSIKQGFGVAIISTPRGLMTDKEAKKAGLGGELICEVY